MTSLKSPVFWLLFFSTIFFFSCKKECADICNEYALMLDPENCTCICAPGLTNFEINGYSYCIRKNKDLDIYILENYNPANWFSGGEEERKPPPLLLAGIPKSLDTQNSFNIVDFVLGPEPPFSVYFKYYNQSESFFSQQPVFSNPFNAAEVKVYRYDTSPYFEIRLWWVSQFFGQTNALNAIRKEVFKNTDGLGLLRFSNNFHELTFFYLGYDRLQDANDAYFQLNSEALFDFPFMSSTTEPYDPLLIEWKFNKLSFD